MLTLKTEGVVLARAAMQSAGVVSIAVKTWLFVAQCNDRIYRGGPPRGDIRRGGTHTQH